LKEEQLAGIEAQMSDPRAIASTTFGRIMNPFPKDDIRYVKTMEEEVEDLKKVTLDDVKSFYKDFYGVFSTET